MKTSVTISTTSIIVAAVCLFLGYLWGRSSVKLPEPKVITKTEWRDAPPVHDTLWRPKPYPVHDTSYVDRPVPVPSPVDTAALFAVWRDYYIARGFDLDFSADSIGTFKVQATVQKNQIIRATSTVIPKQKIVTQTETIYKVPLVQPWVMVGTSFDLKSQTISAGVDLRGRYMIGATGMRMNESWGYTVNLGMKF